MLYKKNDIVGWLNKYKVKNYTLRPDEKYGYVVDVEGHVSLEFKNLTEISVKFGVVSGYFFCSGNQLTSLKGAPQRVGEVFYCNNNNLTSLEAISESVSGSFYCHDNPALGELQDINDLKAIQAYLMREKLAHNLNIKDNKKKMKL